MWRSGVFGLALMLFLLPRCGGDDDSQGGHAGSSGGGSGGSGGADAASGGSAGSAGSAGADAADGSDGADAPDAQTPWQLPSCTSVTGTAAVTFSKDEGASLAPVDGKLVGVVYTKGLVALDTPNVLLAASGPALLRSTDAGCSWSEVGPLPSGTMILAKGVGDRAFAWDDNLPSLVRIDGTTITKLDSPTPNVIGFATDPLDADHVRLGASDAQLWDSQDGGKSFQKIGTVAFTGSSLLAYRIAFDPQNLDHVLAGAATQGAVFSKDGGKSWVASTGLSAGGQANAFEVVVSPVDSNIAWAEGIDLAENLAGAPSEGRHIWRSSDGGASFTPVVTHQAGSVTLTNGLPLVPHPTDANVVYFEFGTYYAGYGTDLFRFDASTKNLDQTHNDFDDMLAITFSPADPKLLYLGITHEQIN